jgi:undecaprenyl phosphate-alpha-L-ara4N flippase subunit ArnE
MQCLFLSGGQVCLKFALNRMDKFSFTWAFFSHLLTNWWFLSTGICMGAATVLWMYLIKQFPFSMVYPMISISYIFGMLASIYIFHETIPVTRWIGVVLIMGGVILIAK